MDLATAKQLIDEVLTADEQAAFYSEQKRVKAAELLAHVATAERLTTELDYATDTEEPHLQAALNEAARNIEILTRAVTDFAAKEATARAKGH